MSLQTFTTVIKRAQLELQSWLRLHSYCWLTRVLWYWGWSSPTGHCPVSLHRPVTEIISTEHVVTKRLVSTVRCDNERWH